MSDQPKRRRGGQPKPASQRKRNNLTFRVRDQLRADLVAAAADSGRSVSQEIEFRLGRDFAWQAGKQSIDQLVAEAKANLDASRIQAIRKAGFQIVREAGGAVTVNISPAALLGEAASGIAVSGFVAAEDVNKLPSEVAIERIAEQVAERVAERIVNTVMERVGLTWREGAA